MYWFLSFKFGNTKIKMCPIRLLTWNVKTFRNVSVETMFREEILARKKEIFCDFSREEMAFKCTIGSRAMVTL